MSNGYIIVEEIRHGACYEYNPVDEDVWYGDVEDISRQYCEHLNNIPYNHSFCEVKNVDPQFNYFVLLKDGIVHHMFLSEVL